MRRVFPSQYRGEILTRDPALLSCFSLPSTGQRVSLDIVAVVTARSVTRQGIDLSELRSRAKAEARRKELEQFKSTVQSARSSQAHQRLTKLPSELDQNQLPGTSSTRKDSSPVKVSVILTCTYCRYLFSRAH